MPDSNSTGWGWSSGGGWTYGGEPQTSGPSTEPGTAYNPAEDPVLQAFWAGYNTPSPGEQRNQPSAPLAEVRPSPPSRWEKMQQPPIWEWPEIKQLPQQIGQGIDKLRNAWQGWGVNPYPQGFDPQTGMPIQSPGATLPPFAEQPSMYVPQEPTPEVLAFNEKYAAWQQLEDWRKEAEQGNVRPLPEIDISLLSPEWQKQYSQQKIALDALGIKPMPGEITNAFNSLKESKKDVPFIGLPETNPITGMPYTDEEAAAQAQDANYGGALIMDESGKPLSTADIATLFTANPNTVVYVAYAQGGGQGVIGESTVAEVRGETEEGLAHFRQSAINAGAMAEQEKTTADLKAKEDAILQDVTFENYSEKATQLADLYLSGSESGYRGGNPYADALNKVESAMSPEDAAKLGAEVEADVWLKEQTTPQAWRDWMARNKKEITWDDWLKSFMGPQTGRQVFPIGNLPVATATDTKALGENLSQYGISVLGDYPYLSPVSRAQLTRIPIDVLNQMASYLQDKGISWSDFMSVGESYYGGGGGTTGTYAIPQQWG